MWRPCSTRSPPPPKPPSGHWSCFCLLLFPHPPPPVSPLSPVCPTWSGAASSPPTAELTGDVTPDPRGAGRWRPPRRRWFLSVKIMISFFRPRGTASHHHAIDTLLAKPQQPCILLLGVKAKSWPFSCHQREEMLELNSTFFKKKIQNYCFLRLKKAGRHGLSQVRRSLDTDRRGWR